MVKRCIIKLINLQESVFKERFGGVCMEKEMEVEVSRYRNLKGFQLILFKTLLILIAVSGILYIISAQNWFGITFMLEQYAGWFLGLMLAAIYIGVPRTKKRKSDHVPWYDWIFSIVGFFAGLYIALNYQSILHSFNEITPLRLFLSIAAIFLVLEGLRRLLGWVLVILVLVFMSYALVAPKMPGVFQGSGTKPELLFSYLYLDTSSMLDLLYLAATIGLAFILFGQTLLNFNGGDIINDIAIRLFGRFRGGPAKVSVIGSSMMGSISGDPVSNVVLTGNITIPLMIKNGFRRAQAAAVEVVSSTGGMIAPPVMGIVAFMIAENLGIQYSQVAIAAIVPAVLYYLGVFIQVDLLAAKNGATRMDKSLIPKWKNVMKKGWILIPIFVYLVYLLFIKGYSPELAGVYGAGLGFVLLVVFQKDVRKGLFKKIFLTLEQTGKMVLEIGIILSVAGFMVGILSITGLGFNLVLALGQVGDFGLLVLLLASAIVCIILGMGLPGVAAYAIVAVMVAPSIVDLGVHPLAVHLFVYYYSIVSNFTPPMAVACFVAAPIAETNPHKVGFTAMRLGVMAYILPFIFVYKSPILLGLDVGYSMSTIVVSIVLALFASIAISIAAIGYLFRDLKAIYRVLLLFSSILMIMNTTYNVVGLGLMIVVFTIEFLASRKETSKSFILNNN